MGANCFNRQLFAGAAQDIDNAKHWESIQCFGGQNLATTITEAGMPRIKTPYYHRVDGLLFLADRPVSQEEFLAALKAAAQSLGIVPSSIEVMADGYGEPDRGPARDID